jgi:hypothetical protein
MKRAGGPSDLQRERITTMTTLAKTTQNPLVRALHSSGLLAEDLDYHVVRASMVITFLFLRLPEVVSV